jgi:hypothetical protein
LVLNEFHQFSLTLLPLKSVSLIFIGYHWISLLVIIRFRWFSLNQSFYLSVYVSIDLAAFLFCSLSIYLDFCLYTCLSDYLSIYISVCLSVCLSLSLSSV